jgi:hypothetical protein
MFNKSCESCETLKMQLNIANDEKARMLKTILSFYEPKVDETTEHRDVEPIRPKTIPWSVQRHMLEADSRKRARILREQNDALEMELHVGEHNTEETG